MILTLNNDCISAKANINKEVSYNRLDDKSIGIVVNDKGMIYVGNGANNEVDVYSDYGKYLYSLPCNTSGSFRIDIDRSNNILIGIVREKVLLTYDERGKLVSSKNDSDAFFTIGNKNDKEFKDKNGSVYEIKKQSLFGRVSVIIRSKNGIKTTIINENYNDFIKRAAGDIIFSLIIFCIAIFTSIYIIMKVKAHKIN